MKPVYLQGVAPAPDPSAISSAIRNIILKATDNLSWLSEGDTVLLKPALNSADPTRLPPIPSQSAPRQDSLLIAVQRL